MRRGIPSRSVGRRTMVAEPDGGRTQGGSTEGDRTDPSTDGTSNQTEHKTAAEGKGDTRGRLLALAKRRVCWVSGLALVIVVVVLAVVLPVVLTRKKHHNGDVDAPDVATTNVVIPRPFPFSPERPDVSSLTYISVPTGSCAAQLPSSPWSLESPQGSSVPPEWTRTEKNRAKGSDEWA